MDKYNELHGKYLQLEFKYMQIEKENCGKIFKLQYIKIIKVTFIISNIK